ncbi:MAG: glutathione S-transferase family protein [Rubellimicrobium sp.]|nr:glutathione S-transferase family protein [Rubellimicrobium sp.]
MAATGRYLLYTRKGTAGAAIEAAAGECGIALDLVEVPRECPPDDWAAFLRVNPRGQFPTLVHPDGTVITESTAILVHLADSHPGCGLIPAPGSSARAFHDRWLAFFQVNVYEAILRAEYPDRYTALPDHAPEVRNAAQGYIRQHFALFETVLTDDGPFLLGQRFQMVDLFVWLMVWWSDRGWLARECPRVLRLWEAASSRPALAAAARRHGFS